MAVLNLGGGQGSGSGATVIPGRKLISSSAESWVQFTAIGTSTTFDITNFEDYESGDTLDDFDYLRISLATNTFYPSCARHYKISTYFAQKDDYFEIQMKRDESESIIFTRSSATAFKATLEDISGSAAFIGYVELVKFGT